MSWCNVEESVRKKALVTFNRTEASFEQDVKAVKEWMKMQPHLPEIMEDAKIKNFLILNKCCIEKTKEKIDNYYTIRTLIPDFYDDANPKLLHMQEYMDLCYTVIHPVLSPDNYRVFFCKMKVPNKLHPRLAAMTIYNLSELRLYEDCMLGEILIFDMNGATLEDILRFTPAVLAKVYAIYKNVYSFRLKAAYIINSVSYINHVITILKLILKPKVLERIHVCKNADILNTIFTKDDLPKDYGGQGPSLNEMNGMLKAKFREYQDRFDTLDKLRVDENLRPEKLNNDELLGYYGNFRKLEVD